MALFKFLNIKDHKRFPVKRFIVWNPRKFIPANLTPFTAVAKLVIRCVLKVQKWNAIHLYVYLINSHHTLETLTVCMSHCYHLLYSL